MDTNKSLIIAQPSATEVNPRKKYMLLIAGERRIRWLSNKELLNLLDDPLQWGIRRFIPASEVTETLGLPELWQRGDAFLQEIDPLIPKPKEKAWVL